MRFTRILYVPDGARSRLNPASFVISSARTAPAWSTSATSAPPTSAPSACFTVTRAAFPAGVCALAPAATRASAATQRYRMQLITAPLEHHHDFLHAWLNFLHYRI